MQAKSLIFALLLTPRRARPRSPIRSPTSTRASRFNSSSAPAPAAATINIRGSRAATSASHSRQSGGAAGQYARRRRHHIGQLRRQGRTEGRHHPDHGQPGPAGRPGRWAWTRASRPISQLQLGRQYEQFEQVLVTWHTSPTQDAATTRASARRSSAQPALGSISVQLPALSTISSASSSSSFSAIPMERRESRHGARRGRRPRHQSLGELQSCTPQYVSQKLIIPILQAGMEKEPELPDVPLDARAGDKSPGPGRARFHVEGRCPSDGRWRQRRACRRTVSRRCARPSTTR